MKNYLKYNVGDRVEIVFSLSDDKGKTGTMLSIRINKLERIGAKIPALFIIFINKL